MSAFNPFDSFFAPDTELNNAVSYLRDCMNTDKELPPKTDEPDLRGATSGGLRDSCPFRHAIRQLHRRINRR
jgi:hypothetical protein